MKKGNATAVAASFTIAADISLTSAFGSGLINGLTAPLAPSCSIFSISRVTSTYTKRLQVQSNQVSFRGRLFCMLLTIIANQVAKDSL